jgi:hypothetical protein
MFPVMLEDPVVIFRSIFVPFILLLLCMSLRGC